MGQQLSEFHLKAIASLAAASEKRDAAEFDARPDLLNCADHVVDLRTRKAMDHDPAYLFTMSTGVDFVPGATHPDWRYATMISARSR